MTDLEKIKNKIDLTAQRDLLAELSIELYNQGFRSKDITDLYNPNHLTVANYLRNLENSKSIKPIGLNKKIYHI